MPNEETNNTSISDILKHPKCRFEKVTFEQFKKDCHSLESAGALWFADDEEIRRYYDGIRLPQRATQGSAGYDFYTPFPVTFTSNAPATIPTGIRVQLVPGSFLMCVPRSGLGFKFGMKLRNSTGIIDTDYYFADNEGHIMARITTEEPFKLDTGDRFMQGIIVPFFITEDDKPISDERHGGFGSTGGAGK